MSLLLLLRYPEDGAAPSSVDTPGRTSHYREPRMSTHIEPSMTRYREPRMATYRDGAP